MTETETQFSPDIPGKPKGLTDNEWVMVQQSRTAKEYSERGGWILFVENGNKKKKHAADSDEKLTAAFRHFLAVLAKGLETMENGQKSKIL